MDPVEFFTSARVHVVAGKGGVGKSTLTAALGVAASSLGLDVLLVEIEGRGGLPGYFGRSTFGYQEVSLGPNLRGRTIRAEDALVDYLTADRLGRVARRMLDTGLVEVISRGAPGLGDLLVLGKIKQLERSCAADVILLDAPASGHALSLLRAPAGLLDAVADGPIRAQAADVVELLTDARRCQVLLVTVPEQTPLNELVETAFDLEDRVGVHLGPVLVNGVMPPPAPLPPLAAGPMLPPPKSPASHRRRSGPGSPPADHAGTKTDSDTDTEADTEMLARLTPTLERAAAMDRRRFEQQQRHLVQLRATLPLAQLTIARRPADGLGPADVGGIADELLAAVRALDRPDAAQDAPTTPALSPPQAGASGATAQDPTGGTPPDPPDSGAGVIAAIAGRAQVIVCVGAGGVGKTSVAAALGVEGARQGRRTVVLTIDPARRLADALGLGELADRTHEVRGGWPGELHVTMLDSKDTFDRLVSRFAADAAQQREILANRFYRNISHALSGTQEYMAGERLYELFQSGRYDLVVLDTPPTRQALDFLDAPARLTRFLDHRAYRLLTGGGPSGRASALAAQVGLGAVRTAGRVVGTAVLTDAIAFFGAFRGMQDGFRERAGDLRALLSGPTTSFVVVAAPQRHPLEEADTLLAALREQHLNVAALVLNRVTPALGPTDSTDQPDISAAAVDRLAQRLIGHPWQRAVENLAQTMATRSRQVAAGRRLEAQGGGPDSRTGAPLPMVLVSELDEDVHDLDGVERLRRALNEGGHKPLMDS